jgi:UDP-N-acetyl-2-amino-2-deoxyglucuronate dehydrogenase
MKFSLIGTGFIMPRHVEAINNINGEIVDIINDFRGEDDWKRIIKKPEADCIVVLTPNDLHYEMVKMAAEEGKKVLCEKPLAIKSQDVKELTQYSDIYNVLQLRYHPKVKKLKEEIDKDNNYEIEMDISVHRDPKYYSSWKGQKGRSGGVLFNLGVHYFDLLQYLFGMPEKVKTTSLDDKTGEGIITGRNYTCKWRVSTDEPRETQRRVFKINGVNHNFSSKDNLSYENLHRFVYRDLLEDKGVTPEEALKSTKLIESLYENS